jgi:hypothetical protein
VEGVILLLLAEMLQFGDAMTYAYGVANFDSAALGEASIVPMVIGPGGALAVKALLMLVLLASAKRWWIRPPTAAAAGFGALGIVLNTLTIAGLA